MWRSKSDDTIKIDRTFYSREDFESFKIFEDIAKHKQVNTYFSKDIQKQAGISENQIKHWTITGVIKPHKSVQGTGKMHVYDHTNLIEAMICRELKKYSINFNVMRDSLSFLREKKWIFRFSGKLSNEIIENSHTKKTKAVSSETSFKPIIKEHSLWEFLKFYPHENEIILALWKDPSLPKSSEPETDEYFIGLVFNDIAKTISLCTSMVIINLSRLVEEAGNFYK